VLDSTGLDPAWGGDVRDFFCNSLSCYSLLISRFICLVSCRGKEAGIVRALSGGERV